MKHKSGYYKCRCLKCGQEMSFIIRPAGGSDVEMTQFEGCYAMIWEKRPFSTPASETRYVGWTSLGESYYQVKHPLFTRTEAGTVVRSWCDYCAHMS
jgi:hypothetical protein